MNNYSGHYEKVFDPNPQCPEPGCDKYVRFTGVGYVHVEPNYQGSRPE